MKFLLAVLIFGQICFAAIPCSKVVDTRKVSEPSFEVTSAFAAYLGELLDKDILTLPQFEKFVTDLKRGVLENPISPGEAVGSKLLIHREGLEKYLELGGVDHRQLLKWAKQALAQKRLSVLRQNETRVYTRETAQRMQFWPVEPGEFQMGSDWGATKVRRVITKSFKMMSTKVTQWQWTLPMGENPSRFVEGENTRVFLINGKKIRMQPDNPVEMVSHEDITDKYIPKLNALSAADDPLIYKIIPEHKKGYRFRLPTLAEREFVARLRGHANGDYHFDEKKEPIGSYAWYLHNADHVTHPVAELKPAVVDGYEFFDLQGNTWEWVQDYWEYPHSTENFIDAQGPPEGRNFALIGGAFDCPNPVSCFSKSGDPAWRDSSVGFRLVTEAP